MRLRRIAVKRDICIFISIDRVGLAEDFDYYRCTTATPSGRIVAFSEYRDRAIVEAARGGVMAALG